MTFFALCCFLSVAIFHGMEVTGKQCIQYSTRLSLFTLKLGHYYHNHYHYPPSPPLPPYQNYQVSLRAMYQATCQELYALSCLILKTLPEANTLRLTLQMRKLMYREF